jgi:mRNA degradation ribonuclease J1/J2
VHGSQGEPLSALTRIAYHDHPALHVERGDTVIISAKPVPGNELRVHDTINQLAKAGAECCTRRLRRYTSPATRARGAAHAALAAAPARRDAGARRVPDAGRARAARA